MYIKDFFNSKKTVVSFEVFPPKTKSPINSIYPTIDRLSKLKPDYISVTYGAGGSSRGRTEEIASLIKNKYKIESLAHLTCVTSTKAEIDEVLEKLKFENIDNILALRGDIPNNPNIKFPNPLHFKHASDLITKIREKDHKFCIAAACYPEGHIESKSLDEDLKHLKEKVDMGVDYLITQLFFNNDAFFKFYEKMLKAGINVPVEAGIMPMVNVKQIKKMTSLCGASIPDKLQNIIDKYYDDPESLKSSGIEYAEKQIEELIESGISGVHLYIMNKADIAEKLINSIMPMINKK